MGGSVESVTLEVIDEGVVEEVRRLGQGCFTLGDDPKVELIVGSGGCWVVGPLNRVFINGVTRERTELAGGELVTFGAVTLRVWPRATPLTSRPRMGASTRRDGAIAVHLCADTRRLVGVHLGRRDAYSIHHGVAASRHFVRESVTAPLGLQSGVTRPLRFDSAGALNRSHHGVRNTMNRVS